MSNAIVTVNVSQTVAPTPPTLQQTGALVSQGATDLTPNASYLLTQLSDLSPILKGALALSNLSWAAGTVTATASGSLGFTIGDTLELTISGATPAGYNGTFLCTVTGATTFTYQVSSNPGAASVFGFYTPEDVAELQAMANTFFAQGAQVAVYVLELGPGNPNDGVTALTAYLAAYPNTSYTSGANGYFYAYLVPRTWDGNASFLALIAQQDGTTARTYFYVTTTLSTYKLYTALMKSVVALVESPAMSITPTNPLTAVAWSGGTVTLTTQNVHYLVPGNWFQVQGIGNANPNFSLNGYWQAIGPTANNTITFAYANNPGAISTLGTLIATIVSNAGIPVTEFSHAATLWRLLSQQPSQTNKVPPFAFAYTFGVTPFPTQGNATLVASLKAAAINYMATGAEGGISNTCLFWGTTMDGNDIIYWYSTDFAAIYSDINLANTVINGSNNPINPLYYDNLGINRLQDTLVATMNTAVGVGLANGNVARANLTGPQLTAAIEAGTFSGYIVCNAVPFVPYLQTSPGDYKIGRYAGLSVTYVPSRGFVAITLNLSVSEFPIP